MFGHCALKTRMHGYLEGLEAKWLLLIFIHFMYENSEGSA